MRNTYSARNWQLIAAGSLAVAVVAVVGIAFIGSQSKIQPFVVVTDQLGSPVAVARPAPVAKSDFDKRLMVAQLAAFIKDVRSMLPDAVAQQVTLNRVYAMAGRDVAGFLNEFFKDNPRWPPQTAPLMATQTAPGRTAKLSTLWPG